MVRVNLFPTFQKGAAITLLYVLVMYGTLTIAPSMIEWVSKKGMLNTLIKIPFLLAIPAVIYISVRSGRYKDISLWLTSLFLYVSCLAISKAVTSPAEILHIVIYIILGFLIFSTLRFKKAGTALFAWSALLTMFFGCVDEGIQFLLPNRFFDWNDILINSIGGIMALGAIRYIFGDRGF